VPFCAACDRVRLTSDIDKPNFIQPERPMSSIGG
jgi:molybdenum cofactor biosynthesis enzyme MoaA